LYEAGVGFDAEASLLPGDETRSSSLVERTLAALEAADPVERAPLARRTKYALLAARSVAASLAVGILLCVALASAWDYAETHFVPKHAAPPELVLKHAEPRATPRVDVAPAAPSATEAPADSALAAPPLAVSAQAPMNVAARAPRPAVSAEVRDSAPSASELFARANEARRAGDIEAAIAGYEAVSKSYPNSVEAEDAKVLVGQLLLSQRSPRAALQQFEGYDSEALALEALWGRAEALRKLNSPDERAVLLELLQKYPDSPYTAAAQNRLRELSP
jgi:TolA-binding protein